MKKHFRAFAWLFCCLSLAPFAGCFGKGFNLNAGDAAPAGRLGDSGNGDGIKTSLSDATGDGKPSSDGSRDQISPDVSYSTGGSGGSGGGIATGGAEGASAGGSIGGGGGSMGGNTVGGPTGGSGLGGGGANGSVSGIGGSGGGNVGSSGGATSIGGPDAAADAPAPNPDGSAPLSQGKPCSVDGDCGTGNCVDGVCCNKSKAACTGCNACANSLTGADDGACSAVSTGQDPHNACADDTATNACGNDGTCDGKGACRKVSAGQTCGKGSCASTGSTFTPAPTCDGAGTCQAAKAQDCGAFQCAATGCLKNCTLQTDCDSASYCDTTASPAICKAKNTNGTKASNPYECTSGIVADGVCCDVSCTGCSACTTALNGQTSAKDGTCLAVAANTSAPHGYCTANPPCGQDGTCDGNKACKYPALGSSCGASSCSGSTLTTKTCDSTHACASATSTCQNSLVCASTSACKTGSCSADTDCIAGDYCASGVCTPKRDDGATCSGAGQCKNGNCVSGTCCNTACGQCNSCSTGICSPTNGASCGGGKVCSGGNCQAGCWISGQFFASGAQNATNSCQVCSPSLSTAAWSNNDGASVPCGTCGGTASCTNQTPGTCSKVTTTMYRDADGDGYGNHLQSAQVCPGTPGYVSNPDDCDDTPGSGYGKGPGYTSCASSTTQQTCVAGGTWSTTTCNDGCLSATGYCRSGTIGIAGSVTCWASGGASATCATSVGCSGGFCGTASSPGRYICDGPNDCTFQTCCYGSDPGGPYTSCVPSCTSPTNTVCDPLSSTFLCPAGYHCPSNGVQLVTCVAD